MLVRLMAFIAAAKTWSWSSVCLVTKKISHHPAEFQTTDIDVLARFIDIAQKHLRMGSEVAQGHETMPRPLHVVYQGPATPYDWEKFGFTVYHYCLAWSIPIWLY